MQELVTSEVPFSKCIFCHCHALNCTLDTLSHNSYRFENRYLAWETVRYGRNPYFLKGTGFEGYLIGWCKTPEEALYVLIDIGREILNDLQVRYGLDHTFHSRLMQTLVGERHDERSIEAWQNELGVILAKLRCHVWAHYDATNFREQTYRAVNLMPHIRYTEHAHSIQQKYTINPPKDGFKHRVQVDESILRDHEQDPWMAIDLIGQFGHPLLRECMTRCA